MEILLWKCYYKIVFKYDSLDHQGRGFHTMVKLETQAIKIIFFKYCFLTVPEIYNVYCPTTCDDQKIIVYKCTTASYA